MFDGKTVENKGKLILNVWKVYKFHCNNTTEAETKAEQVNDPISREYRNIS